MLPLPLVDLLERELLVEAVGEVDSLVETLEDLDADVINIPWIRYSARRQRLITAKTKCRLKTRSKRIRFAISLLWSYMELLVLWKVLTITSTVCFGTVTSLLAD